eukprot:TRINITY_DN27486_c0_g1_i1.p1 TRINITY_DN27486_c0_g1~~TRINITY_DN27486_c0_g1_i1.p1  ORF type:complete len:268 (+),score=35.74 TRINITY_DN27486_c0_g1_i1:174-977(+)
MILTLIFRIVMTCIYLLTTSQRTMLRDRSVWFKRCGLRGNSSTHSENMSNDVSSALREALTNDGLSGHTIPSAYTQTSSFFSLSALYILPCAAVAAGLVMTQQVNACRMIGTLGAAYAFGSNVWLLRYGPKMFKVCSKENDWLGKEAFSTLQAACFPEYFALQSASCILAFGCHIGASPSKKIFDSAGIAMALAVVTALINAWVLGPKTTQNMEKLYEVTSGPKMLCAETKKSAKKKFGMIHGISMLLDLFNLLAVLVYICAVSYHA